MSWLRSGLHVTTAGVALIAAGCSERESQPAKFPGFSMTVPAGKVVETSKLPAGGKHKMKLSTSWFEVAMGRQNRNALLHIDWQAEGGTQQEWQELYLPMMQKAIGASIPGSKTLHEETIDPHRWLYVIGKPDLPMGIGVVDCDRSFAVTITHAKYLDLASEISAVREILASVRCEVTDENRAKPVATTRLPAKFGRTAERDFQGYKSLDGEVLIVNFTNGDIQSNRDLYRTTVKALLSMVYQSEVQDSQLAWLKAPQLAGNRSMIRAHFPATKEDLYVGSLYCNAEKQTLLMLWFAPVPDDERAFERLAQVGCPGEEAAPTRAFSAVAAEACAAGDQAACSASDTL